MRNQDDNSEKLGKKPKGNQDETKKKTQEKLGETMLS